MTGVKLKTLRQRRARTMRRLWMAGVLALVMPASASLAAGSAEDSEAVPHGRVLETVSGPSSDAARAGFAVPAAKPVLAQRFDAEFGTDPRTPTEPEEADSRSIGSGVASFYGRRFAGRPTASGEIFNPRDLTAAHRKLPFGSKVRVTNPRNGKSVIVRVNDRGPFHGNRVIDLSRAAAERIGLVARGTGRVELALLD
jgi:rare lipoprotein A